MEDPSSVCPLISEKNSEIRSVSEEVARLMQGMQEIGEQREEHIQHMRRECVCVCVCLLVCVCVCGCCVVLCARAACMK